MIEPILIKAGGLPEGIEEQESILREIRRSFLFQDFDRLQSFISACHLAEEVIAGNEVFFCRLSRMMEHFLRIMPPVAESPLGVYMRFIGEDMVDTGHDTLSVRGKSLLHTLEKPAEEAVDPAEKVVVIPGPDAAEPVLQETADVHQLINSLEDGWKFTGLISRAMALAAEIYGLPESEREEITIRWLQDAGLLKDLAADSLIDASRALLDSGQPVAALDLTRYTEQIFGARPGLQSLLIDAALKAGRLDEALSRLEVLAASGELTGSGKWLRAACLADLDRRDEALVVLRDHLREEPDDAESLQLLGVLERAGNRLDISIKALVRAWQLDPTCAVVLRDLVRSFHAACMPEQLDLCLDELRRLDAALADKLMLGVDLYLKSDLEEAICLVDGLGVGKCPQRISGVMPGPHRLEWQIPDGTMQGVDVNLRDGCWYKFRQIEIGTVDEQSGRGGEITLFKPAGEDVEQVKLSELLSDYRVTSLDDLPQPDMAEILDPE